MIASPSHTGGRCNNCGQLTAWKRGPSGRQTHMHWDPDRVWSNLKCDPRRLTEMENDDYDDSDNGCEA